MKMPCWSWSSLNNYLTCPAQFEALKVSKRYKQDENEHAIWGNEVHKAIESALKEKTPLPERMKMYEKYLDATEKAEEFYVELQLAVNNDKMPTEFLAPDAWARCIVDYLAVKGNKAVSLDWKTGKRKEGSRQLKMSAAMIFAWFPTVDEIKTAYVWLQENGRTTVEHYSRADISKIWHCFEDDLKHMQWSYNNNVWPANPSGLCRKWCPVLDCSYNGRRK